MAGSFPAGLSSAWTFGGSLLTFILPMSLFIVVAAILYLQCSRPRSAPVSWRLALMPDQRPRDRSGPSEQPEQTEAPADEG